MAFGTKIDAEGRAAPLVIDRSVRTAMRASGYTFLRESVCVHELSIVRVDLACTTDLLGGITTPIVLLGFRGREMRRAFSPANAMHRRLNR